MSRGKMRPSSAVFYRSPGDEYPLIVRGEGYFLWDSEDYCLLDLTSGISATALIGQGRADIAHAMERQARVLSFVHASGATNPPQEELAARLVNLAPEGVTRVMFTSGGSEANELSLRITRQYHLARDEPQRWKVISLHPSYHGATAAALSMTGRWDISRDYEPYLFGGRKIAAPIAFRGPFKDLDDESLAQRAADALEAAIQSEGPDTVAAFIVEPIALSTGMAVPPIQYWSRVREICDRFGVLLITDEVITGVGRTGAFLGLDHANVRADLTNLAKGLGGGYVPLGATLISAKIAENIHEKDRQMAEVHTYSGSPQSCATGLAVLKVILEEGLIDAAGKKGRLLDELLRELVAPLPWVGEVRGMGLLYGIEYVTDRETRGRFPKRAEVGSSLTRAMWKRGFLSRTMRHESSLVGECTAFIPALTISQADLERGVQALREAIVEVGPSWEQVD